MGAQVVLDASADAEHRLPDVIGSKTGDLRNWLRERRRTGDDVFFPADSSSDKRPESALAGLEMKQQIERQRVRLPLNVGIDSGGFQERMAVVIEVIEL